MPDVPTEISFVAAAYREKVATQTVLIERFYKKPDGRSSGDSGSGVIIGRGDRLGAEHLHVATAAHVLADTSSYPVRWCISRVETAVKGQSRVHVTEFVTERPVSAESGLYRPPHSDAFDVGMITIPNESRIQGNADEPKQPFIKFSEHPLLRLTPPGGSLLPGTEVAWCGFPGFVYGLTGAYHLCYYEGVVSAYVSNPERPLYLVDGHAAHGVSGGPIWFCTPDGTPVILGVVSSYEGLGAGVPGLCAFTPMNVLFDHLQKDRPEIYSDSHKGT